MPELCDMFSSIKYVYRTSKFFGILPYKIVSADGETKATPCHYSFLFTVLTSLIIFAHGVTFPFYVFGSEVPCFFCISSQVTTQNTTQHIVVTPFMFQKIALKIINRFVVSMMSFCAIIFALFFSSRIPAFIEKLNVADYFFRTLLQHSEKTVVCCISQWIIYGLLIGSLPAIIYYMYTDISGPDTTLTSVAWLVVLMWDNMNSATCECLFINFVYLIKVRFEIINNYLIDIQTPPSFVLKNVRKVATSNLESDENLTFPNVRLLSIEMCRWCHRCLCDLIVDLNKMYQALFLSTLSGCFLKVLFVVFAMVVGTTSKHSSGMYEEIIKRIFWVVFYGARFFALILFACKTVQEAEHTKTLLAEISTTGEEEETKKELLLFNSQITNRNIHFSACSLFTLNTSLITSVLFVVFAMVVGTTSKHSSGMYEEIIKRIFWVVFYGARFFALILFACKTVQEAEHTKTLLAEISTTGEEEETKKELLLFNSQITNRNIHFSACSLFTLNTSLITSVLFVVFAMVVGTTSKHSSGMYEEIIKRIFWVVFYGARFFALILFACKTVQEAEHTKTLLAEISTTGEEEETKKELLLFNSQITNRNIHFSACSLFTLNTSLITSAVGLGTTYLVILVQFHAPA